MKPGLLSKSERQKLRRLHTQGGAADCSAPNSVKSNKLSVSKVRQILHSKPSYPKFTPATPKNKKRKAIGGFKDKTWCMDLAKVDN